MAPRGLVNLPGYRFDPAKIYGLNINTNGLELRYNDRTYLSDPHLLSGQISIHYDTIIIATDGTYHETKLPDQRIGIGVYVGNESPYNYSGTITKGRGSDSVAKLKAGVVGLEKALEMHSSGFMNGLQYIIIKTHSEYLVTCMTECFFDTEKKRYRPLGEKLHIDAGCFKDLGNKVEMLNQQGLRVYFWLVPREWNNDARQLALTAFNNPPVQPRSPALLPPPATFFQ
jgi:ribonuclease HI